MIKTHDLLQMLYTGLLLLGFSLISLESSLVSIKRGGVLIRIFNLHKLVFRLNYQI